MLPKSSDEENTLSIPNVLADRYASEQMRAIWSPINKIIAERKLWIAVLEAQRDLGVDFGGDDPDQVIADYAAVIRSISAPSLPAKPLLATTSRLVSKSSTRWPATSTFTKA